MSPQPPSSTLFPYTTLFRSDLVELLLQRGGEIILDVAGEEVLQERDHHPALVLAVQPLFLELDVAAVLDRKSTRLNSSHTVISYAVFCLKKKKKIILHNNLM